MKAEYMHIGIPITNKKPNMTWNEGAKFWVSNVDDYAEKIEYLKFEEGTPFPELLHHMFHVAYSVDDLEAFVEAADQVVVPIMVLSETDRLAFVLKDGALIEYYESKK